MRPRKDEEEEDEDQVDDKVTNETTEDTNNEIDNREQTEAEFPTTTIEARLARHVSSHPYSYGTISLCFTLFCSIFGLIVAGFSITVDMNGWWSRDTDLARSQTQLMILQLVEPKLRRNQTSWDEVLTTVQPGIDFIINSGGDDTSRRLATNEDDPNRRLQVFRYGPDNCNDMDWYTSGDFFYRGNTLWPVWRTTDETVSALHVESLRTLCHAEEKAKAHLEANGFCSGCVGDDTLCLPPLSLVYLARLSVFDYGFTLSCDALAEAWAPYETNVTEQLMTCVNELRSSRSSGIEQRSIPRSCPLGFSPFMVDEGFGINDNAMVRTTSSVFSTALSDRNINELYGGTDHFDDIASDSITGHYDTRWEQFYEIAVDEAIQEDMILAIAAVVVTVIAMILHTRSPFITLAGLVQILVSFPFTYFLYKVVFRFDFFPFLNFLGVYVVFAIGADDVFVACDKWKNVRLEHENATTEQIASLALPDAAKSMFLTTSTTAIAFFGTAICPVSSLKMFAIFMGLLIMIDYIMCVLFLFPALCLYDRWKRAAPTTPSWFVECCVRGTGSTSTENQKSLIRRVLSAYYDVFHFLRYPLLVIIAVSFGVFTYFASQLALPGYSGVRLLSPENELEQLFQWRLTLFGNELLREIGSTVHVVWGLTPSDTGDPRNPEKSSVLVLADDFDPSTEASQLHLLNFCDVLFGQSFIDRDFDTYECPMTFFDTWLKETQTDSEEHAQRCGERTSVPVDPALFHSCFTWFMDSARAWEVRQSLNGVLTRDGMVATIRIPFKQAGVRWDNGFSEMDAAWKELDRVITSQNDNAPAGANKAFAGSFDYWWYDTNGSLLSTAIGAIFIALGAAFVVLLGSSRSIRVTMFAVFTIAYILVSVTALLVASGWTLGFLEAVCFAILIGISCDFVLHFGHAYSSPEGSLSRSERTKRSLILMGPSILAAAITTIAAAVVMKFAQIVFFRRFATILLYSLLMGLLGSMLVFLVLTDTFGPEEPTAFADYLSRRCRGKRKDASVSKRETAKNQAREYPGPELTYRGTFIGSAESYA